MAALLLWTRVGNLSQVKRLVEVNHVDPQSSENKSGVPALHYASRFGHLDIVKYFIEERKCDVECGDKLGLAPIHHAAHGGKLSVVKYLINVGRCDPMCRGQDGWTTLHSACKSDSLELVKYLVEEKKIDPSCKEKHDLMPLHIAAEIGTLDVVQYLVKEQQCDIDSKDGLGNVPLHHAAAGGKLDMVEYLINERGCDPECTNSLGWTPLHLASRTGKLDVVKYLKEEKNVNSTSRSHDGSTPLHGAASSGALDVVKYLLEEQQCDIECRNNSGRTALHDAAMEGKLDVVQHLISERGCDPEAVGWEDGQTTLHCACNSGSLDVVKYLIIDRKVQLHKDASVTPLHMAIQSGHLPIVKFLVEECQYELGARMDGGLTTVQFARMLGHTEISSYLSSVVVERESQLDHYVRAAKPTGTVLGHGAYGKVIELTSAGEVVAGKVFRMYGTEDKQEIAKEMKGEMLTMMQLSHPNIVQCKGVSYLPDQPLPVLLMERLMTSLHAYLLTPDNSDLPVEGKVSFLLDTARGLDYLHSRTPAIIHRDLTAKNVLLDSKLRAKIADFGNSRITDLDPNAIPGTMTSLPGTLDFMPPEAQGGGVTYDPSLDVFSFGHLSLFTVIQTALRPLFPSIYTDSRGMLAARSEVERRMQFVEKAKQVLGSHPLLQLIQECLSNKPSGRPQTGDLVTRLQGMMTGVNIEEAELVVKKLLQEEGIFKQKNMVVVLTGLMEAGKTTLLHLLFYKRPPDKYSSTGVTEQSWRGITQYILDTKKFELLDDVKDMFKFVARVKIVPTSKGNEKDGGQNKGKVESTSETNTAGSKNEGAASTGVTGTVHISKEKPTKRNAVAIAAEINDKQSSGSVSFKEMVDVIREYPEELYGELELLHMIDTGGQPECLEVMPTLIHNADLILLLVNLSRSLDECTTPTWHKDGRKYKKAPLIRSNKEIIKQLAHTLAGRSNTKVLVIGTHKDQVPKQELPKVLNELNSFVKTVLPPNLLLTKTVSEIVFDINLLNPDQEMLENIRAIITNFEVKPLEIPPSFAMFERDALLFLNEKKEDGRKVKVMELKECLLIGEMLNMSESVVEAALEYLHKNNIFLFFKKVGPGLVFLDPNVLISFVNTIVHFTYMVAAGDDEFIKPPLALTVSERDALGKGMITGSILRHKYVAETFIPGLFEVDHAVEIFKELYIITRTSAQESNQTEHIMMCLLPRLSQEKVKSLLQKFEQTPPLLVQFGKGSPPKFKLSCSPNGCFGSTIACLISEYNWEICTDFDDKEPECLYHDMVMLHPCGMSLEVTLVNNTKYFEVYIDLKNEHNREDVIKVQRSILFAAESVLKTMHLEQHTVVEGFMCNCGQKSVSHTQYFDASKNIYCCRYGCREKEPKTFWIKAAKHSPWCPEETDSTTNISCTQNKVIQRDSGSVVMGDLIRLSTSKGEIRIIQESAPKCREIGTILLNDDSGARVNAICESAFFDTVKAVRMMYSEWIREKEDHTWKKLTRCLRAVQLRPLARTIEQHFGLPSPSDQGQAREETTVQGPPAKKQKLTTDHASASTGEGNPASAEDKPHEGGPSSSPAHQ